ncbi:TolC family protein, partial [Brevundimonas sp.]|uniref:TolC family protein n=1 Tax=Brevundimonas sp. TaxID=1871086 RepID=UPI003D6D349D
MTKAATERAGPSFIARRLALVLALPLAACVAGPDYREPSVAVPAAFSQTSPEGQPDAAWWRGFGDPLLDRLVAEARTDNLDVRQAALRIEEARHQARIVAAAAWPSVSARAQASHTRLSENAVVAAPPGGAGTPGAPGTAFDTYQSGFDAAWELDLFGADQRAAEAAEARAGAAVWTLRDAEIILTAEVARTYLDYRALDRRIAINDQLGEVQTEA